jgi:hypothetical protein
MKREEEGSSIDLSVFISVAAVAAVAEAWEGKP